MLGYSSLKPIIQALFDTDLVDKIYHTVRFAGDSSEKIPVYRIGDEWEYCGMDDTKIMGCYIRQTGDLAASGAPEMISGCEKLFRSKVLYRIVFFNDHEERSHDDLNEKIMNVVFSPNIDFVRFVTDKARLAADEGTPNRFKFGGTTFYCALDFTVTVKLTRNTCNSEINCGELPNPICKGQNL